MGHPLPPCRAALKSGGHEGRERLCGAPGVPGRVLTPHKLVQHSLSCEQGINPCVSYSPHSFSLGSETGKALTQRTHPQHSQSHVLGPKDCPASVPSFRNWLIPPKPSKTTPCS